MLPFLIGALRAVIEMLGLSLLGMAAMALLAGERRQSNPIFRLFELITRAPRRLMAALMPGRERPLLAGVLCFCALFAAWMLLAAWRLRLA